uniref:Uncharacterized protein n=1 Tax=Rhizophora mucronata TaxID=61149 RepID=A0A2P2PXA3_RHIMU
MTKHSDHILAKTLWQQGKERISQICNQYLTCFSLVYFSPLLLCMPNKGDMK